MGKRLQPTALPSIWFHKVQGELRVVLRERRCCSVWFFVDVSGGVVSPDEGKQLIRIFRAHGKCGAVKFMFCGLKYRLHLLFCKISRTYKIGYQVLHEKHICQGQRLE